MAVLLLLLAIVGAVLVGDLVVENIAAGDVTVWHYPITGYSEGQLLAMAAALGFVLGLLMSGRCACGGRDGLAADSCAPPNAT
jgi:hypothetical protein